MALLLYLLWRYLLWRFLLWRHLLWLYLHEREDGAAPRVEVEGQHQPQRAARHDDETSHHKGRYHLAVTSLGEREGGGGAVQAVTAEGQALALAVRGAACDGGAADGVAPGMVGGAMVSGASRASIPEAGPQAAAHRP